MRTRVQKWGNSLAVRIPQSFARETALVQGAEVELELEAGRLVITPVVGNQYDLEALLGEVALENLHGEIEAEGTVGREIW